MPRACLDTNAFFYTPEQLQQLKEEAQILGEKAFDEAKDEGADDD